MIAKYLSMKKKNFIKNINCVDEAHKTLEILVLVLHTHFLKCVRE